jgi:hypothetical protein
LEYTRTSRLCAHRIAFDSLYCGIHIRISV